MVIIPAADIIENKIVRLKQGNFGEQQVYDDTPLSIAKMYDKFGFEWLHVVDLTASKTGEFTSLAEVKKIINNTGLKIQFGGGVRSLEDYTELENAGISRMIIGSLSVINKPEFEKIVEKAGPEKIVVAADIFKGNIAVKGWTEKTTVSLDEHIKYCTGLGLKYFLTTDIEKDGMLEGPSFELYEEMMEKYPEIKVIASGGISNIEDVKRFDKMNVYGLVIGRAIYENKVNLEELSEIGK